MNQSRISELFIFFHCVCCFIIQVLELHKRLELARVTIRQLPGIEYSKEEQLRRLESLRKQLALKQQLIKKYKNVQF